jgi:hypothetical protein
MPIQKVVGGETELDRTFLLETSSLLVDGG